MRFGMATAGRTRSKRSARSSASRASASVRSKTKLSASCATRPAQKDQGISIADTKTPLQGVSARGCFFFSFTQPSRADFVLYTIRKNQGGKTYANSTKHDNSAPCVSFDRRALRLRSFLLQAGESPGSAWPTGRCNGFMSNAGPVFPLTLAQAEPCAFADRELLLDCAPYAERILPRSQ